MGDETEKSRLERIAELLASHGVRFIVIGGQAEILLGGSRVTFDIDLCYQRTADNLRRLATALAEIKPTLRGAPADLPFQIDARALALGSNFTFSTQMGDLDLLAHVEPIGGYEEIARNATTFHIGDLDVQVICLDDLIAIKRHIQRPKDQQSLMQLLAIKRIREEGKVG